MDRGKNLANSCSDASRQAGAALPETRVPLLKELSQGVRFTLDSLPISALAPDHFFEPPPWNLFRGTLFVVDRDSGVLRDSRQNPPWDPEDWLQYIYLEGKVHRRRRFPSTGSGCLIAGAAAPASTNIRGRLSLLRQFTLFNLRQLSKHGFG